MTFSLYKQLWQAMHKPKLFLGLFSSTASSFITLIIPSFIGDNIDQSLMIKLSQDTDLLLSGLIILLLTYSLQGISSYLLSSTSNAATLALQKRFAKHLLYLPVTTIESYQAGDLSSRLTNDLFSLSKLFAVTIPQLLTNCLIILGSLGFLFATSLELTFLCLILIPLMAVTILPISRRLEILFLAYQNSQGKLNGIVTHKLKQIRLIKSFLGEDSDLKLIQTSLKNCHRLFNKILAYTIFQQFISQLLLFGGLFCICIVATQAVQEGHLTSGQLVAFILYLLQLLSPIFNSLETIDEFSEIRSINKRVQPLFQQVTEEDQDKVDGELSGELILRDFAPTFLSRKTKIPPLSLSLPQGKHLAILGPSGSGKTSLLSTLLRFHTTYEGSLKLNGLELSDIDTRYLRQRIAYASQDSPLLHASIRDNLTYGKNQAISDKDIDTILDWLNLNKLIQSLPNGLDTILSENGEELSAGQRQRLSLARTLLSDADYYLFDEITANLDPESEQAICRAINLACQGKTLISISHRLSAIKDADCFLILNQDKPVFLSDQNQLFTYQKEKNHDQTSRNL